VQAGVDLIVLRDFQGGVRPCDSAACTDFGAFYSSVYHALTPELPHDAFAHSGQLLDGHVPVVRLGKAPVEFERKQSVHIPVEREKPVSVCQVAYCIKVRTAGLFSAAGTSTDTKRSKGGSYPAL